MDLRTFNNWRNEVHNREKQNIRKISQGIAVGVMIFIVLSFVSINGDKPDYTVKINGNKVDSVNYVDDSYVDNPEELSAFLKKERTYVVQAEIYNGGKELEKISKTLDKKGVENLIFVENNLAKLQIGQGFKTREEAEAFALLLNQKGVLKDFTVRVK